MKTSLAIIPAALVILLAAAPVFAEEPAPKCPMCEKMKSSADANAKAQKEIQTQTTEINSLVAKMNGSVGAEKIEALTAIVTRLAEQNKELAARLTPASEGATSSETHQH